MTALPVPLWVPLLVAAPFVGSFLGVLVLRLPDRRTVLFGRSHCDHCGHVLGVRDLVPLASWLWLRGKCRHCGAAIGWFAPAIEIAAMIVVLWAATQTWGAVLAASCVLGWLLLALAWTDWRVTLLPDPLTLALAMSGLLAAWYLTPDALLDRLIAMAAGFSALAAVAWLYRRLRGRDGLGLGDAKLLGALGSWVSWQGLPSVVLTGAVAALAVVLALMLTGRTVTATTRIPLGTFLALGGWIAWLYGPLAFG